MSGGSYNYLFLADDVGEAFVRDEGELEQMALRLHELAPEHPVTLYTERLAMLARQGVPELVRDVWKAVEWCDSGDSSEARLAEVLADADFRWDGPRG